MGLHVVTVPTSLAIHFMVFILIPNFVGKQPLAYPAKLLRAIVTSFTTAISTATLPMAIRCAKNVASTNDPGASCCRLGSTVDMVGTALYEAAATMFIGQAHDLHLGLAQ